MSPTMSPDQQPRSRARALVALCLAASVGTSSLPMPALAQSLRAGQGDAPSQAARSHVTLDFLSVVDPSTHDEPTEVRAGVPVSVMGEYHDDWDDWDYEIPESDYAQLSYQWYAGPVRATGTTDAAYAGFAPIEGATSREFVPTAEQDGSYLACKVTYNGGDTLWSWRSTTVPVLADGPVAPQGDAARLQSAVAALSGWAPALDAPGANVNDQLRARLAELGYGDVAVRLSSVEPGATDPAMSGGIDVATGAVTPFFLAPADRTVSSDYSLLRRVTPTWELSLGEARATLSPARACTLPWDEGRVGSYLAGLRDRIDVPSRVEAGDGPVRLPGAVREGGRLLARVSWRSADPDVARVSQDGFDESYDASYVATLSHGATDATCGLVATLELAVPGYGNGPDATCELSWQVTSAADPQAGSSALQDRVDAAFGAEGLAYSGTGLAVDPAAVRGDVQLPTTRSLGVDGRDYAVTYSCDSDALQVSGYRANVMRPLPGRPDSPVRLTLTVRSKADPSVVASKTVDLTVSALGAPEVEQGVRLMDAARDGYGAALLGDNPSADAVTGSLHAFQKASFSPDGSLTWDYDVTSADAHRGVVVADRPGYDPMGPSGQANKFRSSDPTLLQHENLVLRARPERDTEVEVDSVLAHEDLGRYYDVARTDPTCDPQLVAQLRVLAATPASARFTVLGRDASRPAVQVSVGVVGVDEKGEPQTWASDALYSVPAGSTAADATEAMFAATGLQAQYGVGSWGWSLDTITSPDGRTLGWDAATGRYWQLFVNGEYSMSGAGDVRLQPGDSVTWVYAADGADLPGSTDGVEVVPDAARPTDWPVDWGGFAPGAVDDRPTPEAGELAWSAELGADVMGSVYASDPVLAGGLAYVAVGSQLQARDAATGEVVRTAPLAAPVDSMCRMTVADGLVLVPLHGGRLQALTADALTCVWVAGPIAADEQSLSSVEVADGSAYLGTTTPDGASGHLASVRLSDGVIQWVRPGDAGYYWSGAVAAGDRLVAVDGAGRVRSLDAATGGDEHVLDLGARVRSDVVHAGDALLVVTGDGVLHRLALLADGALREEGSVRFAASSTSTPVVVGSRALVGGATERYKGVLAVVDLDAMSLERQVTTLADGSELPGDVKGAPAACVRDGQVMAYFTCNAKPGGAYAYRLGDDSASVLHAPQGDAADYTMASVAVGADGSLYYVNDSGRLFALRPGTVAGGNGNGENGNGATGGASGSGSAAGGVTAGGTHAAPGTVAGDTASATTDAAAPDGADDASATGEAAPAPDAKAEPAADATSDDAAPAAMPAWPVVGLVVAFVAMVAALVAAVRAGRRD